MKLYTELQVIALTKAAFAAGQNHNTFIFEEELKNLTPIELPSDEEIENYARQSGLVHPFVSRGAKWMRDKLQGGNNEQQ